MRFDSCRNCGTELEVSKICDVCRDANQFSCPHCSHVTDEQIHTVCHVAGLDHDLIRATVA